MSYTPEQLALRQWLSKPYPNGGAGGCCCLGPRRLPQYEAPVEAGYIVGGTLRPQGSDGGTAVFIVDITDFGSNPTKVASIIKQELKLSVQEAGEFLKKKQAKLIFSWHVNGTFLEELQRAGAVFEQRTRKPAREPACGCDMKFIELVHGVYYKITEHRSPDGITHTVTKIGPIGGPYL